MYKVADELLELLCYMAESSCLIWFYGSFLENRLRSRKWTGLFVIGSYVIMKKSVGMILVSDYENINYESLRIVSTAIFSFLILLFLLVGFYKADRFMSIFLMVTFLAVREIGYLFSYTIWQRGYSLFMAFALQSSEKGHLSTDGLINIAWIGGYGMLFLTGTTYIWILFIVLKQIVHSFQNKEYRMHRRELFFLLMPEMTGLLICILLRIIMLAMEQERLVLIYDKYPALVLIVPLILLLSLLSIPYGVSVFQGLIDLNREKSGRVILENQIKGMQGQMEEMEHIYAGIRSMKHDMQNTIAIIMQLTAGIKETGADNESGGNIQGHAGELPALQKYLSELGRSFDNLELRFRTGNVVVDTLLNMKYHEICRTLPELELEADRLLFPAVLHIQSYDMGVILGNALDNAMEACKRLHEKEKEAALFIRLSSFQKGNMFFLEVENSFDGEIKQKAQMDFPATSKPDESAHGLGFMNIKNAVGKYYGAVDWSINGRIFRLSVMMQNEQRKEQENR